MGQLAVVCFLYSTWCTQIVIITTIIKIYVYIDSVVNTTGWLLWVYGCSPDLSDVLADETDEKAIEFAMGGLCNCCAGML